MRGLPAGLSETQVVAVLDPAFERISQRELGRMFGCSAYYPPDPASADSDNLAPGKHQETIPWTATGADPGAGEAMPENGRGERGAAPHGQGDYVLFEVFRQ